MSRANTQVDPALEKIRCPSATLTLDRPRAHSRPHAFKKLPTASGAAPPAKSPFLWALPGTTPAPRKPHQMARFAPQTISVALPPNRRARYTAPATKQARAKQPTASLPTHLPDSSWAAKRQSWRGPTSRMYFV